MRSEITTSSLRWLVANYCSDCHCLILLYSDTNCSLFQWIFVAANSMQFRVIDWFDVGFIFYFFWIFSILLYQQKSRQSKPLKLSHSHEFRNRIIPDRLYYSICDASAAIDKNDLFESQHQNNIHRMNYARHQWICGRRVSGRYIRVNEAVVIPVIIIQLRTKYD